jgi:DNA-binding transcriptional LysR family regulator
MDWDDLRHFLVLAETGSFSAAARRLGVDHTTVARRATSLEAALGVRLVDRLPRAVILTEDGLRIAALGVRMRDDAHGVLRAARGMDAALEGTVRVSAPPAFARHVVVPRLGELRRRSPGIVLDLCGDQAFADLDRREADIALRLSRPAQDGLIARKLGDLGFGLFATPEYLATHSEEAWEFIARDGVPAPLPQDLWLDTYRAGRPVVFRGNESGMLLAAAGAGIGVALLPRFVVPRDSGLIDLDCAVPLPRREMWMAVHDDLRHAPRIRAVMDFLVEAVANHVGR